MTQDGVRQDDQAYFDDLVTAATAGLVGDEVLLANISGERTDFIRLNNNHVRQAGSVDQRRLTVDLIEGRRHVAGGITLTGERSTDDARIATLLAQLREQRRHRRRRSVPALQRHPGVDRAHRTRDDPRAGRGAERHPHKVAVGHDLVGIYAAGDTFAGFGNSLGQRNWFQTATFNLDWCFYLEADKAAKNLYAGFDWSDELFERKVDWSTRQLAALGRAPINLTPGEYRTYLAPRAMEELVQLMSYYGAFGRRAHETRQTPLLRMVVDDVALSPMVSIAEDTAGGVAPNFQSAGFIRPDSVPLVVDGRYADTLVSPRSAQEYGVPTNGAGDGEFPESLALAPGTVSAENVSEALGSGLFVGNLWYTNFSDRAACRTTGMTRFATFWIDEGEIVAPVNVLRFDDTAFHLLGDKLEGLTDEAEVLLDASTYVERSTNSNRLPGALVTAMRFVL